MNKRLRKKKEITYQEAWNKISEFMNNSKQLSFFIEPWTEITTSPTHKNKYNLQSLVDGEFIKYFIADKEWKK